MGTFCGVLTRHAAVVASSVWSTPETERDHGIRRAASSVDRVTLLWILFTFAVSGVDTVLPILLVLLLLMKNQLFFRLEFVNISISHCLF